MISLTPRVTCVVVDVSQDEPEVQFTWFVDNKPVGNAETKPRVEQYNTTFRVESVLPIQHQDWLRGKEFKCKVYNKALPAPIEKTISKTKGGSAVQAGGRLGGTVGVKWTGPPWPALHPWH